MKKGRARAELIVRMARPHLSGVVVDVGADHGHVATMLSKEHDLVIATERRSNRLPNWPENRVVADGLAPFSKVDLAIVCGMGPNAILHVLTNGARPAVAVVHSPERTDTLRRRLKEAGWRIDAEALAPENGRFAEVLRVVPGEEPADGHALLFGPYLMNDPLLADHVAQTLGHWRRVMASAPEGSPGHERARGWVDWLSGLA